MYIIRPARITVVVQEPARDILFWALDHHGSPMDHLGGWLGVDIAVLLLAFRSLLESLPICAVCLPLTVTDGNYCTEQMVVFPVPSAKM